jgi:hypothetical protein
VLLNFGDKRKSYRSFYFWPPKWVFIDVHEFLEMRGVLWWLFGVSMLYKKLDLN